MNPRLLAIFKHPKMIPASYGLIGLGVGVAVGYLVGRRNSYEVYEPSAQLTFDFNTSPIDLSAIAKKGMEDTTNAEADAYFARVHAAPRTPVVIAEEDLPEYTTKVVDGESFVVEKLKEVVEDAPVEVVVIEEPEEEPEDPYTADGAVRRSVFADSTDEWNYGLEIRKRTPEIPHVIHKDEFYSNEREYAQVTVTYYAGDDILADEDDTPIYNHTDVVGPMLFGHGSGDPNVFHVRNDKRKCEYEIVYDPGFFSVEILGLTIEDNERSKDLKHSHSPRKFRQE